jgi:WD40 repeat protein
MTPKCRFWACITILLFAGTVCVLYAFERESVRERPDETIEWHSAGRSGWRLWGRGGDCFYGMSVKTPALDVWQWTGQTVTHRELRDVGPGKALSLTVLNNASCICYSCVFHKAGTVVEPFVRVFDIEQGRQIRELRAEEDLWCRVSRASANGAHIAFWATPDVTSRDYGTNRVRVGMLAPKANRIDWVTTMSCKTTTVNIGGVVPSDDGAYIALSGWDYGAAVVDVSQKKALWQKQPAGETCFADIAFSPDNKTVYAGGTEGCVYGMGVKDGEIASRWFATGSGKEVYAHRITTVSVSPDGRFVAAGTGPEGEVYLFSTKNGKRLVLNHGGSTILITSFSPDSKRLATFAAGQIKIWKVSGWNRNGDAGNRNGDAASIDTSTQRSFDGFPALSV